MRGLRWVLGLLLVIGPLSGCALLPLGPAPIPPITDTKPAGPAPAGETFGTQVSLGTLPHDSITVARRKQYVAARTLAVTALLDARSAAVLHHDRAAFLATVDPTGAAFLASQAQLYANLVKLPLAAYSLTLFGTSSLDPPATRIHDGVDVYLPVVQEQYSLRGFDTGDVGRTYAVTLVQRGGRWGIASFSDDKTDQPVQDPWDAGSIDVDASGTVLVISSGLTPAQRAAVTTLATGAVADDRTYLPGWNGRAVLYVLEDGTLFDRLFDDADGHAPGSYAAAEVPQFAGSTKTSGTTGESGTTDQTSPPVTGTRVLINPADLANLTDTDPASKEAVTLRHELTHVALAPMQGPARPLWLTEGVAQWVAYAPYPQSAVVARQDRKAALGTSKPPHVPTDDDFRSGTDADLDDAYTDAWLVCQDVVDHEGAAALLRTYAVVSALPASDDGDAAALDTAVRSVLHLTVAQLQARYVASVAAS